MSENKIIRVLNNKTNKNPPVWLMRQAGRYLKEYRDVREKAGGFLDLCYNPKLAKEVTLQPIKRFGFDAAILFADILLLPQALGRKLWFEAGEGPRLNPIIGRKDIDNFANEDKIIDKYKKRYGDRWKAELEKAVTRMKKEL